MFVSMELIPIIYCEFCLFSNKFHKKSFELLYILQCMVLIQFHDSCLQVCLVCSSRHQTRGGQPRRRHGEALGVIPMVWLQALRKKVRVWVSGMILRTRQKTKQKSFFSLHLNSNNITPVFPKWNVKSLLSDYSVIFVIYTSTA